MSFKSNIERTKAYHMESWQLEMLISGGIVYWLFQLTDSFRGFFFDVYPITFTNSNQIILLFGIYTISRALMIGFAMNLILRAVWLAFLSINYWFPNGLDKSKLPQNKAYQEKIIKRPNAQQRLTTVEKWANLSFSYAVIFALFGISLLVTISWIIWLIRTIQGSNFIANTESYITYGILLLLVIVQLGILDRIVFARGGASGFFGKLRSKLIWFLELVSLSFLFKREFLVLRTNTGRWLLYLLTFGYLGVALLLSVNHIGAYYPFGTFTIKTFDDRTQYDFVTAPEANALRYETNLTKDRFAFRACIQSDIVNDDYLKLFVVSWVSFDKFLEDRFNFYDFKKNYPSGLNANKLNLFRKQNDSLFNKALNDLFVVDLNSEKQDNLNWRRYKHPITLEEGYLTYIPVASLEAMEHLLAVFIQYNDSEKPGFQQYEWVRIPFVKQ